MIWLQGCKKRCKDCYNPEMWPFDKKLIFSPEELTQKIKQNKQLNGIEGITLSGGEPLLQATQMMPFLRMIKDMSLSVICYTGFDFKSIPRKYQEFLNLVDVLISGPYISNLNSERFPLIGSSNKKIVFLTNRYKMADIENIQIEILLDDSLQITGFPSKEFIENVKEIIEEPRAVKKHSENAFPEVKS